MHYDTMNSSEMSRSEIAKQLGEHLDDIFTYLSAGSHWHMKAANASRRLCVRGFGRWHDCAAKDNYCELLHLEKISGDKLEHTPMIDMQMVSKAEAYDMANMNDFKAHFKMWMDMDEELAECLNHAIHKARNIDMQVYEKLCCLADKTQNGIMRVRMAYDSLDFSGWNPHDISVKSKWVHEYFEKEHTDGSEININLG